MNSFMLFCLLAWDDGIVSTVGDFFSKLDFRRYKENIKHLEKYS